MRWAVIIEAEDGTLTVYTAKPPWRSEAAAQEWADEQDGAYCHVTPLLSPDD